MTTLLQMARAASKFQRQMRSISGGHYRRGTPLVHIRCGGCGGRVATVEDSTDDGIVTQWRGRRFLGVPRLLDCPEHGNLRVDEAAVGQKVRRARETGKTQTVKL
jgi:hypothetical protein